MLGSFFKLSFNCSTNLWNSFIEHPWTSEHDRSILARLRRPPDLLKTGKSHESGFRYVMPIRHNEVTLYGVQGAP